MRRVKDGFIMVNVVAIIVMLVGCDSSPAVPTPPADMSNADLLKQAVANMRALKSYHIEEQSSEGISDDAISGDVDLANSKSSFRDEYRSESGVDDVYLVIKIAIRLTRKKFLMSLLLSMTQ